MLRDKSTTASAVVTTAGTLGFLLLMLGFGLAVSGRDAAAVNPVHPTVEDAPIASIDHPIGPAGRVHDSVEVNGRLFIAGDFTSIDGVDQPHLAEIDPTTGDLVSTFDIEISGGSVYALAASPDGTTLYLGGRFKKVDGHSRSRLAAISLSDDSVLPWNPGTERRVNALATDGAIVIIAGDFHTLAGAPAERIGVVDATNGMRLPWHLSADEEIHDLEWNEHDLVYVAGEFLDFSGTGQSHLASVDLTAGAASSWRPIAPFMIWDVALDPSGEALYAAEGGSLALGGNRLSRFHTVASGRPAWTRQADGDYQAVTTDGTWVYAGGHFDYDGKGIDVDPNAAERRKMLSVDAETGVLTDWDPHFTSVLGIWHLNVTTGGLIVGGDFDRVNWFPQGHVARFTGPQPSPLAPPPVVVPEPLPDAECTTQFVDGYRTITVVSFQAPDEFVIRRNGSWLASPPVDELVITPFDDFGGGFATQWSLGHDLPLDGAFLTRMSVDGGPRLELQCAAGDPLVSVPPLTPPAPEPDPEPGTAWCTVTNRDLEFEIAVDESAVIRRNGSWAHTAEAGTTDWQDPAGRADDTYLIRFVEHGVRRDVACERQAGTPEPEPTCTVLSLPDGTIQIDVMLHEEPRAVVLRRNGSWLVTLPDLAQNTFVDDNVDGSYLARIRGANGSSFDLECGQI